MLCKTRGIHGGHYEECRLLGYKDLVCTSEETHHVSATETSRLMLCKVGGLHGDVKGKIGNNLRDHVSLKLFQFLISTYGGIIIKPFVLDQCFV
jgi:hypothetical protein